MAMHQVRTLQRCHLMKTWKTLYTNSPRRRLSNGLQITNSTSKKVKCLILPHNATNFIHSIDQGNTVAYMRLQRRKLEDEVMVCKILICHGKCPKIFSDDQPHQIWFDFSPKVSEVYSMSLKVEKHMHVRHVNPLGHDAKNTPSIYICIHQENMQWQNTALNQANRSTSLDSEMWTKTSSYMDQLVKEVTEDNKPWDGQVKQWQMACNQQVGCHVPR
jgi:hypothetical protein